MDWKTVGQDLAKFAPVVGEILAGPEGVAVTAVGALVASKLGVEPTPEAVSQAAADPENQVKIAQIEADEQVQLAKIKADQAIQEQQVDVKRLDDEVADRTSARQMQMQTKSLVPAILSFLVIASLLLICGAFLLGYGKTDSTLLGVVVSALVHATGQVINYWFGGGLSSKS